jgi:hypothetical protein
MGIIEDKICRCHFCSSQFPYPAFRNGEILLCPFCGMETAVETQDLDERKSFSAERFRAEVGDLAWRPGPLGVRYVVGNLFNHSADELCWVKIEFELYDESADLLSMAADHVRGLAPGRNWPFKVPVLKATASRALLFDVTCEFGSIYTPADNAGPTGVVWQSPERPVWAVAHQ